MPRLQPLQHLQLGALHVDLEQPHGAASAEGRGWGWGGGEPMLLSETWLLAPRAPSSQPAHLRPCSLMTCERVLMGQCTTCAPLKKSAGNASACRPPYSPGGSHLHRPSHGQGYSAVLPRRAARPPARPRVCIPGGGPRCALHPAGAAAGAVAHQRARGLQHVGHVRVLRGQRGAARVEGEGGAEAGAGAGTCARCMRQHLISRISVHPPCERPVRGGGLSARLTDPPACTATILGAVCPLLAAQLL